MGTVNRSPWILHNLRCCVCALPALDPAIFGFHRPGIQDADRWFLFLFLRIDFRGHTREVAVPAKIPEVRGGLELFRVMGFSSRFSDLDHRAAPSGSRTPADSQRRQRDKLRSGWNPSERPLACDERFAAEVLR